MADWKKIRTNCGSYTKWVIGIQKMLHYHIDKYLFVVYYTDRYLSMRGNIMAVTYKEYAQLFKALSDPNRLMIADMLSCGELCACIILEEFHITQPTLSHHMKILCDCKLVDWRKEGKWTYYSLNEEIVLRFRAILEQITSAKENCICHDNGSVEECCSKEGCCV